MTSGHLQLDIAVDEVVVEHAADLEEVAILVDLSRACRSEPRTVGMFFNSAFGRS